MRVKGFRLAAGGILMLVLLAGTLAIGFAPHVATHAQDGEEGEGETTPEGTPTPDTGYIFGYRQEILFPAGIRFFLGVNAGPDNIDSMTLILRQQDGFEQIVSLDVEDNLIRNAGVVSEFFYFWDFAENPGLTPFRTVNFAWQVKTSDDMVSNAEDEFMLVDEQHGPWQAAGEPPLVMHWLNEHLAGDSIRNEVLSAYGLLRERVDNTPLFWFVIYDPNTVLCLDMVDPETNERRNVVISYEDEKMFPCSMEAFEQFYATAGFKFLQRPTFGYSELQDLLITEMVYETYRVFWQDSVVPAWFLEGLAALHRLHPGIAALDITRDAARKEALFSLPELTSSLPENADFQQRTLWEAQSYLMALYLAERYGAEAPFDLAAAVVDHPGGFNGALLDLTGGDDQALLQAWDRWLFTNAAAQAVQWTPYTLTTPTPTATPTETPIPPTFTPSATPTITVTPTSTFLGAQVPTVIVQERLTATPILTATNTPLPPGSLPTAKPHPSNSTESSGGGNNTARTGGMIIIGVAVVVLVVGLLSLSQRRRK